MKTFLLILLCFFQIFPLWAQEKGISTQKIVDLGLSVKWAGWNVGASSPEGYGKKYGWADPTGNLTSSNLDLYPSDNPPLDLSGSSYDIARAKWGGDWRIPTFYEMVELVVKCKWVPSTYRGVNGLKIIGPNGNSIFMPLAGVAPRTISAGGYGNTGNYWTSTLKRDDKKMAYCLFFDSYQSVNDINDSYRYFGKSIRPVIGNIQSSNEYFTKACYMISEKLNSDNYIARADYWIKQAKKYESSLNIQKKVEDVSKKNPVIKQDNNECDVAIKSGDKMFEFYIIASENVKCIGIYLIDSMNRKRFVCALFAPVTLILEQDNDGYKYYLLAKENSLSSITSVLLYISKDKAVSSYLGTMDKDNNGSKDEISISAKEHSNIINMFSKAVDLEVVRIKSASSN